MRRLIVLFALVLVALPESAKADSAPICFRGVPGITNCVGNVFRERFVLDGGVMAIGYPLTPAQYELNLETGKTYLTQWFERNRMEYHPENKPPYDILYGRLGVQLLDAEERPWNPNDRESGPVPGCLWFEETGHNVCNQGFLAKDFPYGFQSIFEVGGLGPRCGLLHGVDQGSCYLAALQFIGFPLTEAHVEMNPDGDTVFTQWFERARLEWHIANDGQPIVLFGRLGAQMLDIIRNPYP